MARNRKSKGGKAPTKAPTHSARHPWLSPLLSSTKSAAKTSCYLMALPKDLLLEIFEYVHDVRDVARMMTAANNHELRNFLLSTVNAEESGLGFGLDFVPKEYSTIGTWMQRYHIGISSLRCKQFRDFGGFVSFRNCILLNMRSFFKNH